MEQLEEKAAKQQIQMQFAKHQARVAQELAIAKRIEYAEEVEIEEFYDTSGKGDIESYILYKMMNRQSGL